MTFIKDNKRNKNDLIFFLQEKLEVL
jgi:hypothetical protein